MKKILKKLIQFNTISKNSNLELIDFCKVLFEREGYFIKIMKKGSKANLFAYKPCLGPRIILSAHTDTVPDNENWKNNPFKLTMLNGRYYGLGVCDMKSFIAVMLSIAQKTKINNIAFLLTFNEETDFKGAKSINEEVINKYDTIILGEPTNNNVILGNKGVIAYRMTITGKAGHSSNPNNGESAIEKSAVFINSLQTDFNEIGQQSDKNFDYPLPSFNIGKIRGGRAINIIADSTVIDFEFRVNNEKQAIQIESLILSILKQNNINAKLTELLRMPPYSMSSDLAESLETAGVKLSKGASYCTEASIFNKFTNNIIICGPGDPALAHKPDECIKIRDIISYEQIVQKIIKAVL